MEAIEQLFSFIMHIDSHLTAFVTAYGMWTYALLFLIIFCETGLIVVPFLPGDSLLFAAGAITATAAGAVNVHILCGLLVLASILGNSVNYAIGRFIGPKIFASKKSKLFNLNYLNQAHLFYKRFGGKTIIIARFIPIIRTFAPFVAGIAAMNYRRFTTYNIVSALLWISSLMYLGYWFGNLPVVKNNFSLVIAAIIILSILPAIIGIAYRRLKHSC
jgi:membrane-associated protein